MHHQEAEIFDVRLVQAFHFFLFFNHRAKRGGSFFEGSSGIRVEKRLQGVRLDSSVLRHEVVLNVDRFGRNLARMIFGPSRRFCYFAVTVGHQGAEI